MGISLVAILLKNGCFTYVANMDIDESIYIIEEVLQEYMDSRLYMRYCLDNILLQFTGKTMSYIDYKSEIGGVSKTNNIEISQVEKEKIRNNALETLSSLALVN
ncbi:hypothetical protein [Clostridium sp. UBA4395]|uniref:hypothetical protein n=1 Tax=Clostridium sp. UBA4395 TaxID=1946360 RepID=UPI003217CA77